jgi:WD40 repeat protein
MEELTEVITASEFHPNECHLFVYSSSKGSIRLCDMRQRALCDEQAKCKCVLYLDIFYSCWETFDPTYQWSDAISAYCNVNGLWCIRVLFVAVFEEPEDPASRSFFSEIISSVSDVKFSHSGRYLLTRDYLTVKVCCDCFASFDALPYRCGIWIWNRDRSKPITCMSIYAQNSAHSTKTIAYSTSSSAVGVAMIGMHSDEMRPTSLGPYLGTCRGYRSCW